MELDEARKSDGVSPPGERVIDNEVGGIHIRKGTTGRSHVFHTPPPTTADELILKSLAKSIFEPQETDSFINHTNSTTLHSIEVPIPD